MNETNKTAAQIAEVDREAVSKELIGLMLSVLKMKKSYLQLYKQGLLQEDSSVVFALLSELYIRIQKEQSEQFALHQINLLELYQ